MTITTEEAKLLRNAATSGDWCQNNGGELLAKWEELNIMRQENLALVFSSVNNFVPLCEERDRLNAALSTHFPKGASGTIFPDQVSAKPPKPAHPDADGKMCIPAGDSGVAGDTLRRDGQWSSDAGKPGPVKVVNVGGIREASPSLFDQLDTLEEERDELKARLLKSTIFIAGVASISPQPMPQLVELLEELTK